MKFARYLQDTQTPEWKRAYIDYRSLKKHIKAIHKAQQQDHDSDVHTRSHSPPTASSSRASINRPHSSPAPDRGREYSSSVPSSNVATIKSDRKVVIPPAPIPPPRGMGDQSPLDQPEVQASQDEPIFSGSNNAEAGADAEETDKVPGLRPSLHSKSSGRRWMSRKKSSSLARGSISHTPLPLRLLLPSLSSVERGFFTALDAELDKIESFYLDRETEMRARSQLIKAQLLELSEHRRIYQIAHPPDTRPWATKLVSSIRMPAIPVPALPSFSMGRGSLAPLASAAAKKKVDGESQDDSEGERTASTLPVGGEQRNDSTDEDGHGAKGKGPGPSNGKEKEQSPGLDPEEYFHAKKKLKKAVLEHYRGLETLNNFRILNLTGFRKALKKFEKVTMIPAQEAYMNEKVDASAFALPGPVTGMMQEMEDFFAARFVRGNKKKARIRLRAGEKHRSHHASMFCSGVMLGLAVPALVSGVYQSFQQTTRHAISGWDGLLLVYGIFLVPVLLALLVGLNLMAWSKSRVNYVFIFELDARTTLDPREYFEIPSLLFSTLCYAFYLSFARIGSSNVSPSSWPLLWLAFTAFVMFFPGHILFIRSRYWLNVNVGRLFLSGIRHVEFTDFWMGDQFCSLVFTISNLYLIVCAYVRGFDDTWQKCSASSRDWVIPFTLASLPLLARLVQSVKRYFDSKLITHLINAGKYGSGVVGYLFFFHWRHQGQPRGPSLALYCLFAAIYSVYSCSWDFLMDWSILRPHAKYALLRPELVYTNHVPLYYVAIVTNLLIRFIWVFYIPKRGPSMALRTFVAGMLEMLRRWQWNFYRLENEHLGNMDQYRVTREVPLPYTFEDTAEDDDGDEDTISSHRSWIRLRRPSMRSIRSRISVDSDDDDSHM